MGIKRYELSEAQWRRIEAMLPGKASDPGRTAADIQIDGLGIRLEPPRMWLDPNEPLRKQLNERIRQAALMELDSRAEPLDRIPPEGINSRRRDSLPWKVRLSQPDRFRHCRMPSHLPNQIDTDLSQHSPRSLRSVLWHANEQRLAVMRNDHGSNPGRGVGVGPGHKAVGRCARGQSAAQQREAAEGQRPEGVADAG